MCSRKAAIQLPDEFVTAALVATAGLTVSVLQVRSTTRTMTYITVNSSSLIYIYCCYPSNILTSFKGILSTIVMSGTTSSGRIAGTFIATLPQSGLLYSMRSQASPAISFIAPAVPPTSFGNGFYSSNSTTVFYRSSNNLIEINKTASSADISRGLIGMDSFYFAVQDNLGEISALSSVIFVNLTFVAVHQCVHHT